MNPAELSTILHQRRRRRDVQLMDPSNQRRKRSLSSYDLYSSESVRFTSQIELDDVFAAAAVPLLLDRGDRLVTEKHSEIDQSTLPLSYPFVH